MSRRVSVDFCSLSVRPTRTGSRPFFPRIQSDVLRMRLTLALARAPDGAALAALRKRRDGGVRRAERAVRRPGSGFTVAPRTALLEWPELPRAVERLVPQAQLITVRDVEVELERLDPLSIRVNRYGVCGLCRELGDPLTML